MCISTKYMGNYMPRVDKKMHVPIGTSPGVRASLSRAVSHDPEDLVI